MGHLVEVMDSCTGGRGQAKYDEYLQRYELATDNLEAIRYQALEEVAMRKILDREGGQGLHQQLQDLYGMRAARHRLQNMMADGYGYGGEGRLEGGRHDRHPEGPRPRARRIRGVAFMEDYTYDLEPGQEVSLGAHMLEVCPSVAAEAPH